MRTSSLLSLEKLSKKDLSLWVEIYTDPELMSHVGPALSEEKAIKLFKQVTSESPDNYFYLIRNISSDKEVGIIGLMRKKTEKTSYELGVMIGKQYSNKGYAYKATRLLLKKAFEKLYAMTVTTRCQVSNSGANRISKALGFSFKKTINEGDDVSVYNYWEMSASRNKFQLNKPSEIS